MLDLLDDLNKNGLLEVVGISLLFYLGVCFILRRNRWLSFFNSIFGNLLLFSGMSLMRNDSSLNPMFCERSFFSEVVCDYLLVISFLTFVSSLLAFSGLFDFKYKNEFYVFFFHFWIPFLVFVMVFLPYLLYEQPIEPITENWENYLTGWIRPNSYSKSFTSWVFSLFK